MTRVAFAFPGYGAVEPGMCRVPDAELYDHTSRVLGAPLATVVHDAKLLAQARVQHALVVASALASMHALRAHGLVPDVVLGHSVGDFAAWSGAGATPPEHAVTLAALCGGLLDADAARASWPRARAIDAAAWHTPHAGRAHDAMRAVLARIPEAPRHTAWVSTCGGGVVPANLAGAPLLARAVIEPVDWAGAMRTIAAMGVTDVVALGPSRAMRALVEGRLGALVRVHSSHTTDAVAKTAATLTRVAAVS